MGVLEGIEKPVHPVVGSEEFETASKRLGSELKSPLEANHSLLEGS
jgi:hypothetical protein